MEVTGGDLVLRALEAHGVRHVFGLPGDTSMGLYDAFARNPRLVHVLVKDERSAAYMADAYAKVTGRPGVCEAPSGGGALYIVPGVSEADGARVPLVCLTTDTPLMSDDRGSLTALDQTSLFRPATRFTTRVLMPEKIPETIVRAFRHATAGRQGAAHVALPENVLAQELSGEVPGLAPGPACFPAHRYLPAEDELEAAAALLEAAERPMILCGGGFHLSGAWSALERLLELTSIPVVMTVNGKGAVDETRPEGLGVVGGNGGKAACNEAARQADVVLVLGSRLNSTATAGDLIFAHGPRVIQVDLDASQIGNAQRVELGLVGDAARVLAELAARFAVRRRFDRERARAWARTCKAGVERELQAAEPLFASEGLPLKPHRVMRAFMRALPPESVVVCDAGTPTPYVTAYYRPAAAGRLFIAGRSHGSLGYALPAAIGAQFGAPGRPVVAAFGDGSFGMVMGELETVARYGLPIVLVAFRNQCYSWIKCLQYYYYGERYHGVDFMPGPDYCAVARAFGIRAVRPESGAGLEQELRHAVAAREPVFIEVAVECMTREVPPVHAWRRDAALPPTERRRVSY